MSDVNVWKVRVYEHVSNFGSDEEYSFNLIGGYLEDVIGGLYDLTDKDSLKREVDRYLDEYVVDGEIGTFDSVETRDGWEYVRYVDVEEIAGREVMTVVSGDRYMHRERYVVELFVVVEMDGFEYLN